MPKKERERSTRRMPSGAQQYVREEVELGPREMSSPSSRRMERIDETIRATRDRVPQAEDRLHDAFRDEVRASRAARQTERQTSDEDRMNRRGYAEGGMVRGCKAGQMSGKGFSGSY